MRYIDKISCFYIFSSKHLHFYAYNTIHNLTSIYYLKLYCLCFRLSDEMSTKLSRDESSLENVSIKNRPMNITAEYQQLCSEQWLEAKAAVDEATKTRGNTEKEKHEFLLDIFMVNIIKTFEIRLLYLYTFV